MLCCAHTVEVFLDMNPLEGLVQTFLFQFSSVILHNGAVNKEGSTWGLANLNNWAFKLSDIDTSESPLVLLCYLDRVDP